MKALTWHGTNDVRIDTHEDPSIQDPRDVIIRTTSTAICGSDLHIFDGFVAQMKSGDILGHEFMGEVVEAGSDVKRLKKGDKIVVPFVIGCGSCWFCERDLWAACDTTNPDADKLAKMHGHAGAGLFGYSHLYGGYAGGQAEYVRVPHADHGPIVIESNLDDEKVLFLSDIFPTGWMAAENAGIQPGDTVAIWGCGPVGQMTIRSAWLQGAGRVIAIDWVPERLELAELRGPAEVINFKDDDVYERLQEMTNGRGPDSCIDAVGLEAHGSGSFDSVLDKAKAAVMLTTDRAHVFRQAVNCVRKGGHVSVPGVYVGFPDKIPLGAIVGKGLTIKSGQTHVQKYLKPLLELIQNGEIDPSFIITHRASLAEAPELYKTFRDKKDGCIKVVMTP